MEHSRKTTYATVRLQKQVSYLDERLVTLETFRRNLSNDTLNTSAALVVLELLVPQLITGKGRIDMIYAALTSSRQDLFTDISPRPFQTILHPP